MAENVNLSPDMIDNLVNMLKNNGFNNNKNDTNNINNSTHSTSSDSTSSTSTHSDSASSNSASSDSTSSNSTSYDSASSQSSSFDFSELLKNISSNTSSSNNSSSSNADNSNPFGNLDFETILKIKTILETLNSTNNQDSNLLYSLKPYLRKSKQAKLDQYINILKISQVSKIFKKGDAK